MNERTRWYLAILLLVSLIVFALPASAQPLAQPEPPQSDALVLEQAGTSTVLRWSVPDTPQIAQDAQALLLTNDATLVPFGALQLPVRQVALRINDDGPLAIRIDQRSSEPWQGQLAGLRVDPDQLRSSQDDMADLPSEPIVLLRESRMRGVRIAVVAVPSLYAQQGSVQLNSGLTAQIEHAQPFSDTIESIYADRGPFLAAAPAPSALAAKAGAVLHVSQPGLQVVTGAQLTAAGFSLAGVHPPHLRLFAGGQELPLELRGVGDGRFDANDELRFFADDPGSRWSGSSAYWLIVDSQNGLRMGARAVTPTGAPERSSAFELGRWHGKSIYEPGLAGVDGDHWFSSMLVAGPGVNANYTLPLGPILPPLNGTTVLTVTGSSKIKQSEVNGRTMRIELGAAQQSNSWSDWGDWSSSFSLNANATSAKLTLSAKQAEQTFVSGVAWLRPVSLNFGSKGARFQGVSGNWTYKLSNLASGSTLYDVTNPNAPQRLAIANSSELRFQDGPSKRSYLLAAEGQLHSPTISVRSGRTVGQIAQGDLIMIAPQPFMSALEPLRQARQAQGYRVSMVDVQVLYDLWNMGDPDPEAIRSFLRYAAANWSKAPQAVLLVGDGTVDTRGYKYVGQPSFIPPYLADVDPFQGVLGLSLGETACETCYAQLDGDDALSDLLPDLSIGRLPAKSSSEVSILVTKILGYEQAPNGAWSSRAIYISDNNTDEEGKPDLAGDFFAQSEAGIALQLPRMTIERLYYDENPATRDKPGHESDPQRMLDGTKALLSKGAVFATYHGHAGQTQWGNTRLGAGPSTMLDLYDADDLTNGYKLPIMLEMACLTSAFHLSLFDKTSVDERLLLNPRGGALATWGSSGQGVTHGHDLLQKGFFQEQKASFLAGKPANLGALTQAGYLTLFADPQSSCCHDAVRTFLVLGDPLSVPKVLFDSTIYLPIVRN
jgi:hypothetical protein